MTNTLDPTVPPTPPGAHPIAPAGLKGVIVAETTIGSVRGGEGFYHYRQFDATAVARDHSFEGMTHLLLSGDLPDSTIEAQVQQRLGLARQLPDRSLEVLDMLAANTRTPMETLRAMLPLLSNPKPTLDLDDQARREAVLDLIGAVPSVLARAHRIQSGLSPIEADPSARHSADYLRMITGTAPRPEVATALERYLVLTADHGFNNSTFATRVITSTGADVSSIIGGALASLSGPLHGGAPSRVLEMIEAIGATSNTEAWARSQLKQGHKIMGFGHAVYAAQDPRSALLAETASELGGELVERAREIEGRLLAVMNEWRPDATIVTNVEFYAALVLHLAGVPSQLFTPTFAVSRVVGWSAHLLEQAANNKIIRPSARYIGPEPQRFDPTIE